MTASEQMRMERRVIAALSTPRARANLQDAILAPRRVMGARPTTLATPGLQIDAVTAAVAVILGEALTPVEEVTRE